jgi:chemotaxis protein MotB
MKQAGIAAAVVAVVLAIAAYYFYSEARSAQQERDDLVMKVKTLEEEKAEVVNRLEEQIARFSKEKEEELNRLRSTYDTLVTDLQSEIEQGQVTITKMADRLSVSMVDKILFSSGEADITGEGIKVLERVGNVLKNTTNKIVRVEGHTDNVPISSVLAGKYPTNWELSTARATNVVRFLQEKVGIDAARLEAIGMAEFHPVASNETAEGRSQNRRIEIALLPDLRADHDTPEKGKTDEPTP